MEEFLKVFAVAKEYFGGATVLMAAAAWYLFRQRNPDAISTANAGGVVSAIDEWKEIAAQNAKRADDEHEARLAAELRADGFARERNEVKEQMWRLTGQVDALTNQLAAAQRQVETLMQKVATMEGNGNAKP